MKKTILESPFAGDTEIDIIRNQIYARYCMHDMIVNYNEAPYASHLLYTQPGVLDDNVPGERKLGMEAGFIWGECSEQVAVYIDRGISGGMMKGCKIHIENGIEVFMRTLPPDLAQLCREAYPLTEEEKDLQNINPKMRIGSREFIQIYESLPEL